MSIVRDFIEQENTGRIQEFSSDFCTLEAVKSKKMAWDKQGIVTVFIAGVFDLPTPSHRFALIEARMVAAANSLGIDYASLESRTSNEALCQVMAKAATESVKLIISVDTDDNVIKNKAFQPEKGDCPRPIFGWETRAYNLASYVIPNGNGTSHYIADYITRHGVNSCQFCTQNKCPSRDNALMVAKLQPDLVVVNTASTKTVETILREKEKGRLPHTQIWFRDERDHHFIDDLLGGHVSTTSIVQRIKEVQ